MEEQIIRPGKPMDDATFIKYLQQSDFPLKINVKGRQVLDYDLQIVIQNVGAARGHFIKNIFFGNYFKTHPNIKSIAITSGIPQKQRSMLAFFDPKSDHIKTHAIELAVNVEGDKFKVNASRGDKKRITEEIITISKEIDKKIELPSILKSSIIVKMSFKEIPGREYLAVSIDSITKPKVLSEDEVEMTSHEKYFLTNVVAKKDKPDTDILKRIDREAKTRGTIREFITPLMAEDMMIRNTLNRQLKVETVFGYSIDMEKSAWEWTNESTVGYDINGLLKDGQHRLLAIIKSGTTQETMIFCGLKENTHGVLNTGRGRSAGDTMSLLNVPDPNQFAKNLMVIKNMLTHGVPTSKNKKTGKVATNADIVEFMSREEDADRLRLATSLTNRIFFKHGKKLLRKDLWAGMFFLMHQKSKAAAEEFFTRLAMKEKVGKGDETSSIFLLYNILDNWGKNPTLQPSGAPGSANRVRYIITAWNHWRKGDVIDKLIINPNEPMPRIAK